MSKVVTKGEYLEVLLRSPKTVFSTKDVAILWGEPAENAIYVRLNSYVRQKKLIRLRRGLYAKDVNYDKNEVAVKIFTPAYISFETVLGAAGITFQYYSQIFVASYKKKCISIDNQEYSFRCLKENILTSQWGIEKKNGYSIATKERALLDVIYLNKQYYFDNLRPINWERVRSLLPIYGGNKRMEKAINILEASSR